ncbi:MAG: Ig-like domain-containing protein, partial [Patescibacteria group bacterium]|nr:Ig-like domain-containing protein [Patescibacteria group bacterium]
MVFFGCLAVIFSVITFAAPGPPPPAPALEITVLSPKNNVTVVEIDTDLRVTFDEDAEQGIGNITIKKESDDTTAESIDISSDSITGWSSDSLTIDLDVTLAKNTKYYVNIDNTAITDFGGISDKTTWTFTTRPDGNDFTFEDTFSSEDFVDNSNTDAQYDSEDTSYSLRQTGDVWTHADRETEDKEAIQNSGQRGYNPKIALDDEENQMVVWVENNIVKFTHWDGDAWVTMDGDAGSEDISTTDAMCPVGAPPPGGSTYYLYQVINDELVEKYAHHFPVNYEGKNFTFTPENGALELLIAQENYPFADIDQLTLSACDETIEPDYIRYENNHDIDLKEDLQAQDLNVIVASEDNIEVRYTIPQTCTQDVTFYVYANEYGEATPFHFEGWHNLGSATNYEPYWEPVTGHPDGFTYIEITDDNENIYYNLDITMDNTDDHNKDWLEITIGDKTFRIDDQNQQYGNCPFATSDKVTYKHQLCNITIPKSEIDIQDNFDFILEYYGTGGGGSGCGQALKPQIIADDDGDPIVAWVGIIPAIPDVTEGGNFIFARKWDGDDWTTMDGTSVDSEGFFDGDIIYEGNDGTTFHMIASSDGDPMIVSGVSGSEGARLPVYTEWTGSAWEGKDDSLYEEILEGWFEAYDIQLARDVDDKPMVVWRNGSNSQIHFTQWNGTEWTSLDSAGDYDVIETSSTAAPQIEVNSDGNPAIAYNIDDEGRGIGVALWDGDSWEGDILWNQSDWGMTMRMVLDSNNTPILAWTNNGHSGREINVSQWLNGAWQKMDETSGYDTVASVGWREIWDIDMVITSDNRPMIVWSEGGGASTHFTQWNGENWVNADGSGDNDSLSGEVDTDTLDMTINSNNEPSVVWDERWHSGQGVHFAMLPSETISPAVVQSDKLNGSITKIVKATLTADEDLEDDSYIEYYLTNNGGATWTKVSSGEELEFVDLGSDLKWKSILYKGSIPTLNSVRVDYSTQPPQDPTIKTIPECECYELGSVESTKPDTTDFVYSDNNQSSWDYMPTADSDGKDCDVTDIKMIDVNTGATTGEDLETEFVGNLTDTQVIDEDGGKVSLDAEFISGTHAFGGTQPDRGEGVTTDASGNTFITGTFYGTADFDASDDTDSRTSNGRYDVFITKYNANGSYGWTKTFGGSSDDAGYDIVTDVEGNVFITGAFQATVDFDTSSGTDSRTSNGSRDIFITKYNADGSYGWTRTFGGSSNDEGNDISTDALGNVFVTGYFRYTVDFDDTDGTTGTSGTDSQVSSGNMDIFITKYNADGSYGWTRTFGGYSNDEGNDITIDTSGDIFVTGIFYGGVDFDASGSTEYHSSRGYRDVFITKYNADGSYGWTRTFGDTGSDYGMSVSTDAQGDVFIAGYFPGTVNFDGTGGTNNHTSNGSYDIFITKYNADSSYGWTRTFGDTGFELVYDIDISADGSIFVTGAFENTVDFDGTNGTDEHTSNGSRDTFITKYNPDSSYGWTRTFGGSAYDYGFGIATDSLGNTFVTGYFENTVDFDGTSGTDSRTSNGSYDIFITKYNADGSYGDYGEVHLTHGTYQTTISSTGALVEWDTLELTKETPTNTTIRTEVLDSSCTTTLIDQTEDVTLDLSSIDTANTTLCLEITFETTDTQVTPKLDKWIATYEVESDNTGADFTYTTIDDPSCNPVDPPTDDTDECKTTNLKNISETSVDLRVEVDKSYNDKQKFKVRVENEDNGDKETIKLKQTPSDNGMVTLTIDHLNENTNYRFKVEHRVDDSYEYCPSSKKATTDKTTTGTVEPIEEELPVCGSNKKTYNVQDTDFTGSFCSQGTVLNEPNFPKQGSSSTWLCVNGNEEVECTAKRKMDQQEDTPSSVQGGTVEPPLPPVQEGTPSETPTLIPATLGLAAIAIASIPLFPMALQTSLLMLFAIPFIKRKPQKFWGIVFDNETKQPQKNVVVSLVDTKSNEKLETMITDES